MCERCALLEAEVARLTERLEKVREMIRDMRVRTDALLQTDDE